MLEGEDGEGKQEKMTISSNTLEGNEGGATIGVLGRYKDRPLITLVDSGSTRSFMDARIAIELKLPLVEVLR